MVYLKKEKKLKMPLREMMNFIINIPIIKYFILSYDLLFYYYIILSINKKNFKFKYTI
jgi:hypothetical protein